MSSGFCHRAMGGKGGLGGATSALPHPPANPIKIRTPARLKSLNRLLRKGLIANSLMNWRKCSAISPILPAFVTWGGDKPVKTRKIFSGPPEVFDDARLDSHR